MVDLDAYPCNCGNEHHHNSSSRPSSPNPMSDSKTTPSGSHDEISAAPKDASYDEKEVSSTYKNHSGASSVQPLAFAFAEGLAGGDDAGGRMYVKATGNKKWEGEKEPFVWKMKRWAGKTGKVLVRHTKFMGPGVVSAVSYFDPGNWSVDLQAGSAFGYKLLFVILLAGLGAALLQIMSLRLGICTSTSLAVQIRALFLRLRQKHPKYKVLIMTGLYVLYGMAEVAVVAADLAELLGSAVAFNLLFPALPLYAGVLITASDVLIVLFVFQHPERGRRGMLAFEFLIVALVLCVFICFIILLIRIQPDWVDVFEGFLPSSTLIESQALYLSVGVIGATVMPHALFLGSHLATIDRLDMAPRPPHDAFRPGLGIKKRNYVLPQMDWRSVLPTRWQANSKAVKTEKADRLGEREEEHELRVYSSRLPVEGVVGGDDKVLGLSEEEEREKEKEERDRREVARYEDECKNFDKIDWVRVHIAHATADTTLSLFGFAVTINSSILIVAAAAFFFGADESVRAEAANADLFSAHELISRQIGKTAAFIFALALLCSGQSASITCTLAGQVVSEGFIAWRTSPFLRRVITRLIGVIPSTVVAIAVGRRGINTMLVASQVTLSIVLPFVIFPLVYLASQKDVMVVSNPPGIGEEEALLKLQEETEAMEREHAAGNTDATTPDPVCKVVERDFTSHWLATTIGYVLFSVVTVANAYVIVSLVMGTAG